MDNKWPGGRRGGGEGSGEVQRWMEHICGDIVDVLGGMGSTIPSNGYWFVKCFHFVNINAPIQLHPFYVTKRWNYKFSTNKKYAFHFLFQLFCRGGDGGREEKGEEGRRRERKGEEGRGWHFVNDRYLICWLIDCRRKEKETFDYSGRRDWYPTAGKELGVEE